MGMGAGVGGSGKGGGQATSNGQPVYYDSTKGQYYTTNTTNPLASIFGIPSGAERNYLGNSLNNAPGNFQQSTAEPQVYNASYANTNGNVSGNAFNNGVNSDSGVAAILAGLYNSGVFNQQQLNPYAPQGTVGSFTGIPYGQQQESMFSRSGLNGRHPYGGYQGQTWNPYGNYYTSNNTSASGGNTNNNLAPPPGTTGPDALQQLSFMMNRNNTQI